MRIGYLVSQYPAASHTFIRREVMGLRALGHILETFSIRQPDGLSDLAPADQQEQRDTWYVMPLKPARLARSHLRAALSKPLAYAQTLQKALRHRAPGVKSLVWSTFHFAESIDLAIELQDRKIDHLHNHFANAGANVGYLASQYLSLDWSLTLHGTSEFDYPAGLLLAEKIQAARFVACVTHFGRAQAMRLVDPVHWDKFRIVRAGIEPPPKSSQATTANATARPRLVCVARLSPEKGHAGLIQAFAKLIDEGVDAELELVGDGPDRPRIEAQVAQLGLGDRVILRGQVGEHDAMAAMSKATVGVLASFMEGLPVVIMEALALGVPVVAPCVAGIPELVEHGVSGLTFPPGDWDSLTNALRQMLTDPELRRRTAQEGKRRIEKEFYVEESLKPLIEAFASNRSSNGSL